MPPSYRLTIQIFLVAHLAKDRRSTAVEFISDRRRERRGEWLAERIADQAKPRYGRATAGLDWGLPMSSTSDVRPPPECEADARRLAYIEGLNSGWLRANADEMFQASVVLFALGILSIFTMPDLGAFAEIAFGSGFAGLFYFGMLRGEVDATRSEAWDIEQRWRERGWSVRPTGAGEKLYRLNPPYK